MKTRCLLVLGCALLAGAPLIAQPQSAAQITETESRPKLTKFDLDFPGGTPAQLVGAIEKAMGRPVNAIILPEDADRQLPALKMNNVDAAQLFFALLASTKRTALVNNWLRESQMGFQTSGDPTDESIWYFFVYESAPSPAETRFFLLSRYLKNGLSVDDITTAIQTAWKMNGNTRTPQISFHKETNLLIAAGSPEGLMTIHQVLEALKPASDSSSTPDRKP